MKRLKLYHEFINEKETSEYQPPKYLVSPAPDPQGHQKSDDKIYKFIENELKKSKKFFEPSIKSPNPPEVEDSKSKKNT